MYCLISLALRDQLEIERSECIYIRNNGQLSGSIGKKREKSYRERKLAFFGDGRHVEEVNEEEENSGISSVREIEERESIVSSNRYSEWQ